MSRPAIAVVVALLFLGVFAGAADQEGNFAGTWVLDKEKSDLFPKPLMGDYSGVAVSEGRGTAGMGGPAATGRAGGGFGGGPPGGFGGGMPKMGPPPEPAPLVIEQGGDEVKLTISMNMGGKMVPYTETIKCDGKESETMVQAPGSTNKLKQITKATIKKNKLQVEKITHYPNYQGKVKRVYSLSKEDKVLTMKMEDTSNPKMMMVQTQVYNRQEAAK